MASKKKLVVTNIVLIALLLISNIWWLYQSKKTENPELALEAHLSQYPLLDPALAYYDKHDLIVDVQEIRKYLRNLPVENKDWADMSIYFEVLNTGANVSVNPDLQIWPASLSKLPVGMIAMRKVQLGEWDLKKTPFVLTQNLLDTKFNADLADLVGKTFSLDFLLDRLLLDSDNTAYNIIVSKLTEQELNSIAEAVGLEALVHEGGTMNAKDYTRLLRALYLGTYLNDEYSQKLLSLLNNSEFKGYIRAGIPSNVAFAHKWGIYLEKNIFADSGIIYLENRPYLISVMIQAKSDNHTANEQKAQKLMGEIGRKTYEFMSTQTLADSEKSLPK